MVKFVLAIMIIIGIPFTALATTVETIELSVYPASSISPRTVEVSVPNLLGAGIVPLFMTEDADNVSSKLKPGNHNCTATIGQPVNDRSALVPIFKLSNCN